MKDRSEYLGMLFWFCYIPPIVLFYEAFAKSADYMFLRWVVCGFAVLFTYNLYKADKMFWAWAPGLVALIYNPLIPFHFERSTWQLIDIVSGIYFILQIPMAYFAIKKLESNKHLKTAHHSAHK